MLNQVLPQLVLPPVAVQQRVSDYPETPCVHSLKSRI
jgi:hypothetical protein